MERNVSIVRTSLHYHGVRQNDSCLYFDTKGLKLAVVVCQYSENAQLHLNKMPLNSVKPSKIVSFNREGNNFVTLKS